MVDSHTHYTIKSYNEVFESDENYSSWKMEIISGGIFLRPSNEKVSDKKEIPSKDNSYTLSGNDNYENNYYLVSQIDNVKNDGWLKNDRNEYYFVNKGEMTLNQKVTLNFEFYAETGQYIYFDYRSFLGMHGVPTHNHYFAMLNDKKFNIDQALDEPPDDAQSYWYSYDNFTYDHMLIPIEKTGTQNMKFEYEVINEDNVKVNNSWGYNYGYIRNIMLLTHINSGNQLDISKVPDGANVIYIESNEDDDTIQIGGSFVFEAPPKQEEEKVYGCYTCSDDLVWTNNPNPNCKIDDSIKIEDKCVKNPVMGVNSTVIIILIIASISILGVVLYNRKNRFSKI